MDAQQARDAYDALADEDKARVRKLIESGRDRVEAVQSVTAQVGAFNAEQPTSGEKMGARALGAAEAVLPDTSKTNLGLTAAFNPVALPITSATALLRKLTPYGDAVEKAKERAPGEFGEGMLGGAAGSLVAGGAPAALRGLGALAKGAKAAKAAAPTAAATKAEVKGLGGDIAEGLGGKVVGEKAASRLRSLLSKSEPPSHPKVSLPKRGKVDVGDYAPAKQTDDLLDRLAKADPMLYGAADDAAPILTGAPKPPARPRILDPLDDVPAPKGAPLDVSPELRTRAVQMLDEADDVAPVAAKAKAPTAEELRAKYSDPDGPIPTPEELAIMYPDANAVPTSSIHPLGPSMEQALPIPMRPQGAPPVDLKAEATRAVANGESLDSLVRRLGVPKSAVSAFFKGAQLGF